MGVNIVTIRYTKAPFRLPLYTICAPLGHVVLPQRMYFTPEFPAPSCALSPLAPCGPWAPVFPTAPCSPFGPGGPGNGLLVPGFPCSPKKYQMSQSAWSQLYDLF